MEARLNQTVEARLTEERTAMEARLTAAMAAQFSQTMIQMETEMAAKMGLEIEAQLKAITARVKEETEAQFAAQATSMRREFRDQLVQYRLLMATNEEAQKLGAKVLLRHHIDDLGTVLVDKFNGGHWPYPAEWPAIYQRARQQASSHCAARSHHCGRRQVHYTGGKK